MPKNYGEPYRREFEAMYRALSRELKVPLLPFLLEEKGLNLSGGQKQRTLIARSFHSGAQLYLWDDAISALDPATERKVIANLRRLNPEAILVLATHRLSSLAEFDQILVMDKGSIVKRGTLTEIKADPTISGTLAE